METETLEVEVEPTTEEEVEIVTTQVVDETANYLQLIHEDMAWIIAFQVLTVCVLLIHLFLTGLKAGK